MDRYKSGARSSVKKFDGKNYKAWAFNMQLLLSRERGMSIVNKTETAPAGPTEEIPAELDKNGDPIKGTGRLELQRVTLTLTTLGAFGRL
jgi:hypothetical protein